MSTVDDFPDFSRGISTAVEYCVVRGCGAVMTFNGCSNPECPKTRPLYPLMEALRTRALNKHYGTNRYSSCKEAVYGTR